IPGSHHRFFSQRSARKEPQATNDTLRDVVIVKIKANYQLVRVAVVVDQYGRAVQVRPSLRYSKRSLHGLRRRAEGHAFAYPAFRNHRAISLATGHEAVVTVELRREVIVQTPYRRGTHRASTLCRQQGLEGNAFIGPAVILFLQFGALVHAAGVEVRIDEF